MTLTAIHPDGRHRTPSRHIPLNQANLLYDALVRLLKANALGWGAFIAVGLRRRGLSRFRRGGASDLMALPALFVDVDDPTPETQERLSAIQPQPSCIVFTGGGYHAYWWLDEPLDDMMLAGSLLQGLQRMSGGDTLSVTQSLRLVGSRNTKPDRGHALCRIVEHDETYYPLAAFEPLLHPIVKSRPIPPQRPTTPYRPNDSLNAELVRVVSERLSRLGYVQQGDWLSGPCPYPMQHQHDDAHHSFGFNTRSGYGNCFRCGSILLKDICFTLGIRPTDYGGIYTLSV